MELYLCETTRRLSRVTLLSQPIGCLQIHFFYFRHSYRIRQCPRYRVLITHQSDYSNSHRRTRRRRTLLRHPTTNVDQDHRTTQRTRRRVSEQCDKICDMRATICVTETNRTPENCFKKRESVKARQTSWRTEDRSFHAGHQKYDAYLICYIACCYSARIVFTTPERKMRLSMERKTKPTKTTRTNSVGKSKSVPAKSVPAK